MPAIDWTCGWCSKGVAADPTWQGGPNNGRTLLACPNCNKPTVRDETGTYYPGSRAYASVGHLPADVNTAWEEAVACATVGAHTAAEVMCRKILMHVAVDQAGSTPGQNFVQYIDDLDKDGFISKGLKPKIDEIRQRGNVANHELPASTHEDADKTLAVTRHLLVSIYELPNT